MLNQFTHPWKDEEIKFLKENIAQFTYKQMENILGRSSAAIQSKVRYLPIQKKIKKHRVNSNFFKVWSPEMAYVLGFIAADGNICHSGRAYTLQVACDDNDVIEKIKFILSYNGPIYQKTRSNGKTSYSLRICDQIIFNDLQKLNITERKSLTIIPPKISAKLTRHFIRGYFDGDGSVSLRTIPYKSKLSVDFYSASKPMIEFLYREVKRLLRNLYNGKIQILMAHQKTPYYRVHLGQKSASKLFIYMYNNANIYLERKYKIFSKGLYYGD